MANVPTPWARRVRRWLRFSLRTLLVFVTLLCIVLGIWLERVRRQYAIVKAISDTGGWVEYEIEDAKVERDKKEPLWHKNPFGRDLFHCVRSATVKDRQLLKRIAKLRGLTSLTVRDTKLRDDDLLALVGCKSLRSLELTGSWREGMWIGMPTFHPTGNVQIESAPLTDRALENVVRLESVQHLEISGTHFSKKGLQQLAALKRLKTCRIDFYGEGTESPQKSWVEPFKQHRELEGLTWIGPGDSVTLERVNPWTVKNNADWLSSIGLKPPPLPGIEQ